MSIALITGTGGLVGSECVRTFAEKGLDVVGIDNDMRRYFFGESASTSWCVEALKKEIPQYKHKVVDIRNRDALEAIFSAFGHSIKLVLHAAAQPSHDWAAKEPLTDFTINALGTLNLLEMSRQYCPEAVFIFMSTNKVYGDCINSLTYSEYETRYWLRENHPWSLHGVDETMSIDQNLHSLFGVSKASADLLVQEYGRYFGMRTACFRGGCLTGSAHSAAPLHGFLGYVMRCALFKLPYIIYGYKGKQVRDNIHVKDLANAFVHFFDNPCFGEVYNIGGGTYSNISVLEAIEKCQELTGNKIEISYNNKHRIGDHQWWISDVRKFKNHYPEWEYTYDINQTLHEIYDGMISRGI